MEKENLKIDLGCGNSKRLGFIGVDNNPNAKGIDIVWDLDKFPYPIENDCALEIYSSHVAEHLNDLTSFLREVYRISRPNAEFIMKVPHYSYGFAHPLHKRSFSVGTFNFFNGTSQENYGNLKFKIISVKMFWRRPGIPHSLFVRSLDKLINLLANLKPSVCERYWCYWVGGFEEIEFKLKIEK